MEVYTDGFALERPWHAGSHARRQFRIIHPWLLLHSPCTRRGGGRKAGLSSFRPFVGRECIAAARDCFCPYLLRKFARGGPKVAVTVKVCAGHLCGIRHFALSTRQEAVLRHPLGIVEALALV